MPIVNLANSWTVEIETVMKFVVESEGGRIPAIEDLDDVHGVLLTGSKYDAHGNDDWILKLIDWIRGEELFRTKGRLFLHQMHVDHVVDAPTAGSSNGLIGDDNSVVVWGSSDTIQIQGIYDQERLLTTQGHLGYDKGMVKKHVDARFEKGLIKNDEQMEDAKEKAGLDHDGVKVAGAILRFFHGEDRVIKS